ncbi:sugar/nucleoside kinase (ribokinase family) [Mucilaginibacter frigoritolerans]|uniref:Sugar/nucleoside kinase (Ribokinase family) n=1 Tax=Mucilaginibacter frigoritolerans TaxID=652788 RepID=A0A562U9S7_9SPHI|nr:PfkB family carbohydrate kinase [Mucilaginibacter frigoritolerans]TWJ02289.1 sugar/nucleoside kinase (ribokinase family) [Mucilaginibacter frigoritolerans]
MYDICCIGHITSDKIVTTTSVNYMPGGTAFYFSYALSKLNTRYLLVTSLAEAEMHYVDKLRNISVEVRVQPGAHTVYFENIYAENQDERTQNVLQTADTFTMQQLKDVSTNIFHLGPLLANDISLDLIKALALKGTVSLDVQGYLRKVVNYKVQQTDWVQKSAALPYISILKADVAELSALTGLKDVKDGALKLADAGVKEVVITNGSRGSLIYKDGIFYKIPAYQPSIIADATGCGDTYMAGYLYQRSKDAGIQQAGEFAAAMAGLKTEKPGPFKGTEQNVIQFLAKHS